MRRLRLRLTVRRLMLMVALAAMPLAVWAAWFDPVRRWQRAVTDDENGALRWQALDEMGSGKVRVDKATAFATLTEALRSPSYRVRETAVAGLGVLGPEARPAAPALVEALADPELWIRVEAAATLVRVLPQGDTRRGAAMTALKRLLGDRSRQLRLRAACTLAEFGYASDALPILIDALRRPDYLDQADALWHIGCIGPAAAVVAVPEVKALESRAEKYVAPDLSRLLRVYAAEARCRLGDRTGGVASLQALATSPDAALAGEARRALSRLPDQAVDRSRP